MASPPGERIWEKEGHKEDRGLTGLRQSLTPSFLPPDVDECAWEANLCQEDQRCVNLLGSYHCLPDCRPGFRVAADGASCEGDQAGG